MGIFATEGGAHFTPYADRCLEIIKQAIEIDMGVQEKTAFMHCKDNAISALGKIMKHQSASVSVPDTFPFWFSHLPLEIDFLEAKECNQILADALTESPEMVIGAQGERLEALVKMLADQFTDKNMEKNTMEQFGVSLIGLSQND